MAEQLRYIDIAPSLASLVRSEGHFEKQPADPHAWKQYVRGFVDWNTHQELHGGHRNLVVKEKDSDITTIYWRTSEVRWPQIIRGILLEDTMSRHFDIPGRELVNPHEPVRVTPEGLYTTKLHYVPADYRYPWTTSEIASGAELMTRLHKALACVTFDRTGGNMQSGGHQWLHLDFGRGNVLFDYNSAKASTVIDYENVSIGPREMDLGRTASLLLVDSQLKHGVMPALADERRLNEVFYKRLEAWFSNYGLPHNVQEALLWAGSFLISEDYGDLNHVRTMALRWIQETFHIGDEQLVDTNVATRLISSGSYREEKDVPPVLGK